MDLEQRLAMMDQAAKSMTQEEADNWEMMRVYFAAFIMPKERAERGAPEEGVYSEKLQCEWLAWGSVADTAIVLQLPQDNYCDMKGAVDAAKGLLPSVRYIFVVVGGAMDLGYVMDASGKWSAVDDETAEQLLARIAAAVHAPEHFGPAEPLRPVNTH